MPLFLLILAFLGVEAVSLGMVLQNGFVIYPGFAAVLIGLFGLLIIAKRND